MKRMIACSLLALAVGCSHVPRDAIMINPETGDEIVLSKRQDAGTTIPYVNIFGTACQRRNQQSDIELWKGKGYQMKWQSKEGL